MAESYRILVVEDDEKWRKALSAMFLDLFHSLPYEARLKEEAEEMMKDRKPWDIVSLDLCLKPPHGTAAGNPDSFLVSKKLLEGFHFRNKAHFVICCTGIAQDKEVELLLKNDVKKPAIWAKTTVPVSLNSLFPGRNIYIPKAESADPVSTVKVLRKLVADNRVNIELACGRRGLLALEPKNHITITFLGRETLYTIRSDGFRVDKALAWILENPKSGLVKGLPEEQRNRAFLSPEDVLNERLPQFGKGHSAFGKAKLLASYSGEKTCAGNCGYTIGDHPDDRPDEKYVADLKREQAERDAKEKKLGIIIHPNLSSAQRAICKEALKSHPGDLEYEKTANQFLDELHAAESKADKQKIAERFSSDLDIQIPLDGNAMRKLAYKTKLEELGQELEALSGRCDLRLEDKEEEETKIQKEKSAVEELERERQSLNIAGSRGRSSYGRRSNALSTALTRLLEQILERDKEVGRLLHTHIHFNNEYCYDDESAGVQWSVKRPRAEDL